MIKKRFFYLLFVAFSAITSAQSISFTSATLTKGLIGNTIQVDYEYTIGAAGYIYCAIENQQQDWTAISTVVSADLNPAPAGTSVAGSFFLTIPTSTTPYYDLPNGSDEVQTIYRIKIQLSNSSFVYQDGKFPGDWINLTNLTNFTGATDSDWATASNWDVDVPNASAQVTIPASKTVVIGSATVANTNNLTVDGAGSLTVNAGGSLIVAGTPSGNITYNVAVSDTNWHLISSPVVGEQHNDAWVASNSIPSSTLDTDNRAIATYDNTSLDTDSDGAGTTDSATGHWRYFEAGGTTTFGPGVGYSIKRTAGTNYAFTGTYPDGTINPTISTNASDWNLIGNPYPSNMDIATFITENSTTNDNLADAFPAIYVWNGATYTDLTTGSIQPGQAFFIKSKVDGTASITNAMQTHVTGTFYKSDATSISLLLSSGASTKKTKINYLDGKTASFDAGFDIGMFDGVASDIRVYSHLIENNQGTAFARQALPSSDLENLVVPIGVKAAINAEITFSAEALNLPEGIKVFLEDRTANTFTRLDEANSEYKVILSEVLNGTGRFYIHTAQKALSIDTNATLENVSIYKADKSTLRIVGLQQGYASFKLFNMLGKQMMNATFKTNGVQDVSLPQLTTGVYIVQLTTEAGKLNKKIVLE